MFSVLFDFLTVTVLEFIVGTLLLSSESRSWVEEGPSCLWMAAGSCRLPALPQLGRRQWRRPTTLDSSSFASGFLGTTALTFPPTRFCFLKDCVQELFCCFHFTLPIKVFLKAGWAAFLLLKSSALSFGRIIIPTPSDGGGNMCGGGGSAGYFPTWRECGTNCVHSVQLTCEWLMSDCNLSLMGNSHGIRTACRATDLGPNTVLLPSKWDLFLLGRYSQK